MKTMKNNESPNENTRRNGTQKTPNKRVEEQQRTPAKTQEVSPGRRDADELPVVTRNHKALSHHQEHGSTSLTSRFGFLGGGTDGVWWPVREKTKKRLETSTFVIHLNLNSLLLHVLLLLPIIPDKKS
jgi:hypothetical protein